MDLAACERDGVEVARRATGGFAILHTDELTYRVATPPDDPRAEGAILDAYRRLSEGLLTGLHLLGVPARMNPVVPGGVHNASAACFEAPSAYEISIGEQKLIGSAQCRPQGRVLQHGSLPLYGDIARVVTYLAFASEAERGELAAHLRERATTLSAALGRAVRFDEAAEAMGHGFAEGLNPGLCRCSLSVLPAWNLSIREVLAFRPEARVDRPLGRVSTHLYTTEPYFSIDF